MKKSLIILFVFFISLFNSCDIYASNHWRETYGDNDLTGVTFLLDSACVQSVEDLLGSFDTSDYYWLISRQRNNSYVSISFIPKEYILYRTGDCDLYGNPLYALASYNEETGTLIRQRDYLNADVRVGRTQTKNGSRDVVVIDSNEYSLISYNGKYAYNEEYALKYFQTMDASFLENAEDFITVPYPLNVSMYEASDEQNLYLYWEQTKNELINNPTLNTNISIGYYYTDNGGNIINLGIDDLDVESLTHTIKTEQRNQFPISYAPLVLYDTGYIEIDIWNEITILENDLVFSDVITLKYYLSSGEFTKQVFDKDGNAYDDNVITSSISDYGSKNDSFTGGNPIISNITGGDSSDFSIIGGLSSLFGLLGDTGVVNCMKRTFDYYPNEIFTLIFYGLLATIIISLYNRATK